MSLKIAPTEPPKLKALGASSSLPERFGVDVFWTANKKLWGVQRKEYKDLLASADDGRLTREAGLATKLDHAFLVVEGWPTFTGEGEMVAQYGRPWTLASWTAYLLTCWSRGFVVWATPNLVGTCTFVEHLHDWSRKDRHGALSGREPMGRGMWGTPLNREYGVYVLSSIDGIGPELAGRIYDTYGIPLEWTVTDEQLAAVPGLGPKKIATMRRALEIRGDGFK